MQKKKITSFEKIVQHIRTPGGFNSTPPNGKNGEPINSASSKKTDKTIKLNKKRAKKLEKMSALAKLQTNLMQTVLQKIDRQMKPIMQQNKAVTEDLESKEIFLDQENFDILKLLQSKTVKEKKETS